MHHQYNTMATKDIRKLGITGLNGIRYDQLTPEQQEARNRYVQMQQMNQALKKGSNPFVSSPVTGVAESVPYQPGTAGFERGRSKYDTEGDVFTPVTGFDDLQQRRSEAQPWWDAVANGVAKFAGRAATSFVNGVLGAPIGIISAIAQGDMSGVWDNPFANAMSDIDSWFDENFVNYKSLNEQQNERNGEWWKNLDGINMWMDDVLTNVGFTVGMIGSAMVTGGIGGAAVRGIRGAAATAARGASNALYRNTATLVNRAARNVGQPVSKFLTIANSSMGEAALEGLGAKREMMESETGRINEVIDRSIMEDPEIQQLDSSYQQQSAALDNAFGYDRSSPQYQQYKQQLDNEYNQRRSELTSKYEERRSAAMQQLEENAQKAGDAVVGLNLAILIPSNFNLAGRFVDKAFRSAERSAGRSWAVKNGQIGMKNAFHQSNITGNAAEGYGSRSFVGNVSKRIGSNMFSEGIYEEMGQGAASAGAKQYHSFGDVDNYWRARLDPDSVDRVTDGSHDFLKALGYGLEQTYGSAEGWKEGFIGGITGALFGAGEVRDEWRNTRFAKRTAKELNNQLGNENLPRLLQHLVAQASHETNKAILAEEGNQNDWKTEDDKALFSLISSFARAGRMDDLYAMIDQHAEDMTDEQVQSIIDGAVREVTPDEQREQMRQAARDHITSTINEHLKEGVTQEDLFQARARLNDAKQNEQQTREQAAQTRAELASANEKTLRKYARAHGPLGAAAKAVLDATIETRRAQEEYDMMLKDKESGTAVDEAVSNYDNLMRQADEANPSSYWGPAGMVDEDGNKVSVEEARKRLKHNTDRIRQAVEGYKRAVEDVNRRSLGILSKDQEDYLAYLKFLGGTHAERAEELIRKWRGVLPEIVALRHDNAETIAKRYKLPTEAVTKDPNREGWVLVNTKDLTDEQYGRMMLNDLIRNQDVTVVDDDENEIAEETERTRKTIKEEALARMREETERTGTQREFNREEFERDFEDIEKCFGKSRDYNIEFDKAMMNPEGILTAKERAIRWLTDKYQSLKEKLRSRELTDEEIADLDEEGLKRLDQYRFDKETLRRLLKAIEKFIDDRLTDVGDKTKAALEKELNKHGILVDDVLSVETQKLILKLVKDRIKENLDEIRGGNRVNQEDGSVPAFSIDRTEIIQEAKEELQRQRQELEQTISDSSKSEAEVNAAKERLAQLDKQNEELQKKVDEATKDGGIIIDGIKATASNLADVVFNKYVSDVVRRVQNANWQKNFINAYNKLVDFIKDRFAKMREKVKEATGIDVSSPWSKIKEYADKLLHKLSDQDLVKLDDLKRIVKQKLDALEKSGKKGSTLAKNLRKLLKTIEAKVREFTSMKQRDTDPVNYPPNNPGDTVSEDPNQRQDEPDSADDIDAAAGTKDTEHSQSPSLMVELEEMDKDATTPFHVKFKEESPGTDIWQSVTGEFARRSRFTYRTYHEIIDEELKKYPDAKDDDEIKIDAFEEKGDTHTLRDWKMLARRSEAVHNRLTQAMTMGHIDAGNVTVGTKLGFLITYSPETDFIIYLTQDGKPIADLNHPRFAKNVTGLQELYDFFKEKYEAAESTENGVDPKVYTTVNNVFAGFLKYNNKDEHGNIPTSTVDEVAGSTHVTFAVNKSNGLDDVMFEGDTTVFGMGAVGQPFVLIDTPGQQGMTRKRAVPVSTQVFGDGSIEAQVIEAAAKKASKMGANGPVFLQKFLLNFLNCRNVFISTELVEHTGPEGTPSRTQAMKIEVITRDMRVDTNDRVKVEMYYYPDTGKLSIVHNKNLRANVSHALLNPVSTDEASYESVAATDSTLPQTYTDFLRKVCHTKLSDAKTHNSWITVNKLVITPDGEVEEVKQEPIRKRTVWKTTGQSVLVMRDPYSGETFKITVKQEEGSRVPKIAAIHHSVGGSPLTFTNMTQVNKDRLLDVIARAIMTGTDAAWGEKNSFSIDGLTYEFGTNPKGRKIEHPKLSDIPMDKDALDKEVNDALAQIVGVYDSLKPEQLYERYFYEGTISNDPEMQDTLKKLIAAKKRGITHFGSFTQKKLARLVNAIRPVSKEQTLKMAIAKKLQEHLTAHGVRVNLDPAEGQKHVTTVMTLLKEGKQAEAALYSEENGISFFIGPDGETVYGFAGKNGLWLDPDLLNPESLIHEYTHLWSYMLRNSGKENMKMWSSLVTDLRDNHKELWNKVKAEYPWLKTDDEIADEVFARMSGEEGERRVMDMLSNTDNDVESAMEKLRDLFHNFMNAVKKLLGIKATAQTMQELVFADLLSDQPLANYEYFTAETALSGVYAEEQQEEQKQSDEQVGSSESYNLSQLIYNGTSDVADVLSDAGFRVEGDIVYMDGKTEQDLNNIGVEVDTLGIGFHIEFGTRRTADTAAFAISKALGPTYIDNVYLKFNTDPSFVGASEAIDRLEIALSRNRINTDDFLLAVDTMLTEQQRDHLWETMKQTVEPGSLRYEIAAKLQSMFEAYMRGEEIQVGFTEVFGTLKAGIEAAVKHKADIKAFDELASSGENECQLSGTPQDALFNLSYSERRLMYKQYLDTLTPMDINYLEMAGYSEDVYRALPESGKEQLRKCIL